MAADGCVRNLSESNGRQKPAAQSKFRCVIIKIGAGRGFWKAALRITPNFRALNLGSASKLRLGWHFPSPCLVMLGLRPNRVARPAQELCGFIPRSIDCLRLGKCVACLSHAFPR